MVRHRASFAMLVVVAMAMAVGPALTSLAADADGPTFGPDLTPLDGTTGDPFTFCITVEDPDGLLVVEVRYWYGTTSEIISPMAWEPSLGAWAHTTRLPPSERAVHWRFRAQDLLGNWNETSPGHASIADNDPPELLSDMSAQYASPGAEYVFQAELSDNTGVRAAWVLWAFDGSAVQNLTLSDTHPMAAHAIVPATGVSSISFHFEAVDPVGNGLRTADRMVQVVDDRKPPELGRDSSPAFGGTGADYKFEVEAWDDLELAEVRVVYRLGEGPLSNRSLSGDRVFSLTIVLPMDSTAALNYSFFAQDHASNVARTRARIVAVVDIVPPMADAGSDLSVEEGEELSLDASASTDNIGIVAFEWSYVVGVRTYRIGGPTKVITLPKPGVYIVTLVVRDAADNEGQDELVVNVTRAGGDIPLDGDAFLVGGHDATGAVALFVAIAVAALYLVVRRARRGRPPSPPRRRGRGSRSTSRRSQVGYSSTR
jgi:hypothetical protein